MKTKYNTKKEKNLKLKSNFKIKTFKVKLFKKHKNVKLK